MAPTLNRLPGRTQSLCADASRFLQLAWEQYLRSQGQSPPTSWIQGAADREVWKQFTADWGHKNQAVTTRFYSQPPQEVDLERLPIGAEWRLFHASAHETPAS